MNTVAEIFSPGEFLREELEARGWSQTELAEIIGRRQWFNVPVADIIGRIKGEINYGRGRKVNDPKLAMTIIEPDDLATFESSLTPKVVDQVVDALDDERRSMFEHDEQRSDCKEAAQH